MPETVLRVKLVMARPQLVEAVRPKEEEDHVILAVCQDPQGR
jgi:hypothetical protein